MASTRIELNQPFLLGPEMARRIGTLLQDKLGPVTIEAHCADKISRKFKDIEQLVSYHNVSERAIETLAFKSRVPGKWSESASIRFSSISPSAIQVSVESDSDDFVLSLRDELLMLLRELRPWYSRVATPDVVAYAILLLMLAVVISLMALSFGILAPNTTVALRFETLILILLMYFLMAWLLNWAKSLLFPIATFAIGEGIPRHKTMENARWAIAVGLAVSLVASAIYSAIS
jgi:hypothetical protein